MKILQVCNKVPYPLKDGGALAIHNLAAGLANAGAEVRLLVMNTSKHKTEKTAVQSYFSEFKNISIEPEDINTDVTFTGALKNLLFSDLPYNAERFININFDKKLETILRSETFDIVQFEGLYLMPYIKTVRKYSKAKIALRAHNVEHEIWQRNKQDQKNLLKKRYFSIIADRLARFEQSYINQYDLLVPITGRDAEKFSRMGNLRPVCVSPYGFIRHTDVLPEITENNLSFFFIGALDWIPNQQGIIWFIENVWNRILKEIRNPQLHIAGRNAPLWFRKFLKSRQVIFAGEVDNASDFTRDKSIMIVPLFSGSGMRVKIVEAMAAGKAVISTSIGAEGIDLTDNYNYLLADKSEDFVNAAKKLCSDNDFYLHIAKNAIKFVEEKLDNKMVVSNLLEFYKLNL